MLRSGYTPVKIHRLAPATLLAMLLIWCSLAGAQAHAIVLRSDPPDSGVVAESPHEIRLWFSEAVSPQLTQARVLNMKGEAVPSTTAQVDPGDPTLLVVTVPELPDGVYNVVYTALSTADGHATQGHMVFKVGTGEASGASGVSTSQPSVSWAEVVLRWLNFLSLATVTGAVATAFVLLTPRGIRTAQDRPVAEQLAQARRRVLRWGAWCALVGLVLGVGLLLWQAALFAMPAGMPGAGGSASATLVQAAQRLLGDPQFGTLWMFRQALLLVIAVLLFILEGRPATVPAQRDPRGAGLILGLLVLALLTVQALSGHATTVAPAAAVAIVADVLHLASASFWVGGLLALAVGLLKPALAGRGTPAYAALLQAGWRPFGALAAVSVGVLFATGLYSTGRQVASVDALLATLYGRALLAKIALVLVVGLCGLLNASLFHPVLAAPLARTLRRPPGWTPLPLARFPVLVTAELGLGALVFLATGLMTTTPPPHGPQYAAAAQPVPGLVMMKRADDLLVVLQDVKPNQPGQNIVSIRVADTRRPPPAEILRVIVRFTYLAQNLGVVSADAENVAQDAQEGLWQLGGDQLSLAGPWQIQVAVRRKGLEDSIAQFDWAVAEPGGSQRPVIVSDRPLEPVLTVVSAGMLAVVVLMATLARLARARARRAPEGDLRVHG